MAANPVVKGFWDEPTGSWQYVFHDPETMQGAVVDAVWNYDPRAAATSTESADAITDYVRERGIEIVWVLDTHPHADHFMAARILADRFGAPTAIGEKVVEVQRLWKELYGLPAEFPTDGRQWDRLFADGERFMVGAIPVEVMFTPGHTLASVAYRAGDAVFAHDTLMMPDSGTSRADFPGGDARALHRSIRRILSLPPATRVFVGHDYAPGREARCCATVEEHLRGNTHLADDPDESVFVARREARDATLALPALMLAALQVNIRGGRKPEPDAEGRRFLRIPLDRFETPEAA